MNVTEAMERRHSVRQFEDRPIAEESLGRLRAEIERVNREYGLRIQLRTDEAEAFQAGKPQYGRFSGCRNYLAMVAEKGRDEVIGYCGEALVLLAQQLQLNSCWVALTFKKGKVRIEADKGEKLYLLIALGYGKTQGAAHKSKAAEAVSDVAADSPEWYKRGLRAALLAPTAMNQQKFKFTRAGERVSAKAGLGFYTKLDLGIVKYHFELGAGRENFSWAQ